MVPVSWQMGALALLARAMFCATSARARSALLPACSRARWASITSVTSAGKKGLVRRISSRTWAWNLAVFMASSGGSRERLPGAGGPGAHGRAGGGAVAAFYHPGPDRHSPCTLPAPQPHVLTTSGRENSDGEQREDAQ